MPGLIRIDQNPLSATPGFGLERQSKLRQFVVDDRCFQRHEIASRRRFVRRVALGLHAFQLTHDPMRKPNLKRAYCFAAVIRIQVAIDRASLELGGFRGEGHVDEIIQKVRRLDIGRETEKDIAN